MGDIVHDTLILVEIYPREGTETLCLNGWFPDLPVEIYPREGTETCNA